MITHGRKEKVKKILTWICESSHEIKSVFYKQLPGGILEEKLFSEILRLRPATLLKQRLWHMCLRIMRYF